MQHSNSLNGLRKQKRRLTLPLMLALTLLTLLLVWPTASAGQDASAANADSVMLEAANEIDELNRIVAKQDSLLVAQREYYIELLVLKDQHIEILEETVKDALGSPTKDFLEKLIWGLAGYGLHAAGS